jgi:arylsulfatase A-like enzyme
VYLADPSQLPAALATLGRVEGLHAFANDSPPGGMRNVFPGRSGDLTLVPAAPNALAHLTTAQWLQAWWGGLWHTTGAHGFDPQSSDMGAIFYALGRGVPRGSDLGEVRAIDVAPTAAALLGISPPAQSEGQALFRATHFASGQTASKTDAKP